MARGRSFYTLSDLKKSKVADRNKSLIHELEVAKGASGARNAIECEQVRWMWSRLSWWAVAENVLVEREYRFHPVRRWRFDFAVPAWKVAIEYEGLNSEKSGHTTLNGYTSDTEKYNAATSLGWRVIRFTVKNYKKVLQELEKCGC